ncbi:unnamed protein product [Camellia sinensis]
MALLAKTTTLLHKAHHMERFYMKSLLAVLVPVLAVQSCIVSLAFSFSNLTDQSALLAFKTAVKYDPNNVLGNWTTRTNFCNWAGVSCSRHRQRVTALQLPSMRLGGTISPHIGNLSFLMKLDLVENSFHGFLIQNLTRLLRLVDLNLHDNLLEGEIPTSIQQCQKLQVICLANNRLVGQIPVELTTLPLLRVLYLGGNNLTGTLPPSFGNLSNFERFYIDENYVYGNIPNEIGHLKKLKVIDFNGNYFTGSIPPTILNISTLQKVFFSRNGLSGNIPPSIGLGLPNLEKLDLSENKFSGKIPLYLSNCSKLDGLEMSFNQFTGPVPRILGHFRILEWFSLANNPLGGIIPESIGNLSSNLQYFDASTCQIKGEIPKEIGSLKVNFLALSDNDIHGTIPSTIGEMKGMQRLYLDGNELEGPIPDEICLLANAGEISFQNNKVTGSIPHCIGNLSHLQRLFLGSNKLNSSIPSSLWNLENLLFLDLSSNLLGGNLDPNIKVLKVLESMDLSSNNISGDIPNAIAAFQSLNSLNLSRNSFWGSIPKSFGNLITLDFLDLSHNNLSGAIPKALEALSHLKYLNLSFNRLSGEIPSQGPFMNFTADSFIGNEALCGPPTLHVPPCTSHRMQKARTKLLIEIIMPTVALVIVSIALFFIWKMYQGNNVEKLNSIGLLPVVEHKMFSYQDLSRAANDFCEANLLGVGSYSSVYKGVLSDGEIVALKVLNLQVEGAFKNFDAECNVLRAVRHRNLVKVISTCSNPELRVLVLQYMPNGSLEKWLYSHNFCLNLFQRVSIMVDVALALEYLHYDQAEPVVHCDLKPSNVLLDDEMVAHVADFGIAKILAQNKTTTQTKTLGTLGYIAPEYGSEGRVSTKGDIYSYGIMLLEAFTRKKPTDEMFTEALSLKQWVNASLPDQVMEVVDGGLLRIEDGRDAIANKDYLLAIMETGVECAAELPERRTDIKDVVTKLNKIKLQLLRSGYA